MKVCQHGNSYGRCYHCLEHVDRLMAKARVSGLRAADLRGLNGEQMEMLRMLAATEGVQRAAADIATWPQWMQHNLTPPRETMPDPEP